MFSLIPRLSFPVSFSRSILLGVVLVSGAVLPVGASAIDDQALRLIEAVKASGMVNVIVTVRGSSLRGELSADGLDDVRRQAGVRSAQETVLRGLSAADFQINRQFKHVPQLALRVNRRALEALLADDSLGVVESKPRRLSLAQSVPRIYPNHTSSRYTGNAWTVAALDTGIDRAHPFIGGRVVSEACYSDANGAGSATSTLCPNGTGTQTGTGAAAPCSGIDGCDHGTHVAGIAIGDRVSFDGVARQASLIAIQVFSRSDESTLCSPSPAPCTVAYPEDIIAGLERVYALRNSFKIAAVNLSLGGERLADDCSTEPEKPMIDQLKSVGIATVAASGNGGFEDVDAPACVPNAVAIGSTPDNADTRSSYSNNGPALDLYAPGETITSSVPGGGYDNKAGTSMSAAHVSGGWAVLKQLKPAASVSQVEGAFKNTGPLVTSNGIPRRRIDVKLALDYIGGGNGGSPADINIVPILQLLLL